MLGGRPILFKILWMVFFARLMDSFSFAITLLIRSIRPLVDATVQSARARLRYTFCNSAPLMTKHSSSAAAEARDDDDAELKGAPMAGLSMDVVRLFLALVGLLGEHARFAGSEAFCFACAAKDLSCFAVSTESL